MKWLEYAKKNYGEDSIIVLDIEYFIADGLGDDVIEDFMNLIEAGHDIEFRS